MKRLVNVFLRGAADGLNILAPVGDPAYHANRPTLALPEGAALDVGIDGFGLHPRAPRLAELVRGRAAALVPAAGYHGQTRSHFQSQAILENAVESDGSPSKGGSVGWLGAQLAKGAAEVVRPFRGVAVGSTTVPPSLWGTGDALGAPQLSALRLGALAPRRGRDGYEVHDSPSAPDGPALSSQWAERDAAPEVSRIGAGAAVEVLGRLAGSPLDPGDTSAFGQGEAAEVFAAASALLDSDLGTEVVQIDLGGWDTHQAQGSVDGTLAELLAGLDAGLGALVERHVGRGDGLVVTVMTEFGRRVRENASGGTDHGTGGLAIVVGDGVAGGLRGRWPGLEELADGDVVAANDLRVLQAEVAAAVFGTGADLPAAVQPLDLFAR